MLRLKLCFFIYISNINAQTNFPLKHRSITKDILQYSGIKRLIEMAIEGFNSTAFCYGQTGSGKTHTLTGPPELVNKIRFAVGDRK